VPVGDLKIIAVGVEQALPGTARRHDPLRLERAILPLVRHLEEQQVRELLGVLDRADAVVAQHVAVRPQLVDQPPRVNHPHRPPDRRTGTVPMTLTTPGLRA
jgi:hypothetical protein